MKGEGQIRGWRWKWPASSRVGCAKSQTRTRCLCGCSLTWRAVVKPCVLCPASNSFSINEDGKVHKQHSNTNNHQGNLKASQTSCEFHLMDNYAPKTFDGLKKMHEFNKHQNRKKEEVLLKSITQPLWWTLGLVSSGEKRKKWTVLLLRGVNEKAGW